GVSPQAVIKSVDGSFSLNTNKGTTEGFSHVMFGTGRKPNTKVCQKTGDPNKLMFCKRCDGAYHCYCQHPPHENVNRGPYLCLKHTRCHSCSSTMPGSGSSLRYPKQ
ncbi:zinc finger, FYVE/PHD-type containing protein, partial [Tanacetum coccineum]